MLLARKIADQIAGLAADRTSGATALVLQGVDILQSVAADRALLPAAARALCAAQPAMAGFRTAAALALSAPDPIAALQRLAARLRRSPDLIARLAVPIVRLRRDPALVVRVVTCSRSATVERTLAALAAAGPLVTCCADSQPGGEGAALAEELAARGLEVELYGDAAIGTAVPGADAILVGADAVTGSSFINKVGTAALAALGRVYGVPVLVLAGREKVLPEPVFAALRYGLASDGQGLRREPPFERVPLELAAQVVTDAGAVPAGEILETTLWSPGSLSEYMSVIESDNMLDKH